MYGSRIDQKQLEFLAAQVLLNEKTRLDKENERKYGQTSDRRNWAALDPQQKQYVIKQKQRTSDRGVKNKVDSGQYTSKIGKKFLVRCLNSFTGVYTKPDGSVVFSRVDSNDLVTARKTVHFAINGAVSSHAFNSWEEAMIAIIVDPNSIEAKPRSTRLEDAWYVVDRNGELNVGRALILLPSNMSIPDSIKSGNIKRYEGTTVEDRNKAIENYISSNGGAIVKINAHGGDVKNADSDYDKQAETYLTSKELNRQKAKDVGGAHTYSFESFIEEFSITMKAVNQEAVSNNLQMRNAFNEAEKKKLVAYNSFEDFIRRGNALQKHISNYLINNKNEIDKNTYFYLAREQKNIKDFLIKNKLLAR